MNVGFYHVATQQPDKYLQCARQMIASVRAVMPDAHIVHFTDEQTPSIKGTNETRRGSAGPVALRTLEHYAACEGEWLLLDTDVIVQRDVRKVFRDRFDIAVATREGTFKDDEPGTKFMQTMPYNKGAVFSRSSTFWMEAACWLLDQPVARQEWMGDQMAFNVVIARERYAVKVLPASFNYPPKRRTDPVQEMAIVHYKGGRKVYMPGVEWPRD